MPTMIIDLFHKTIYYYYYLLFQINRYQGNPELETTRHMKNCINFIRRHEICKVWDVSLSHYPSQRLRVFFATFWETGFREACNHYLTSKSNRINMRFNSPPGVFKNTTNFNFKNRSTHFSGRVARLASCLPVYSDRSDQFILTVKNKSQVTIWN